MWRRASTSTWRRVVWRPVVSAPTYSTGKSKQSPLPFELGKGHNIRMREEFVAPDTDTDSDVDLRYASDSDLPHSTGHGGMSFGDCDEEHTMSAGETEEEEEEDRSHPVEDTGFEFRRYAEESEDPEDVDTAYQAAPSPMSIEEQEALELPADHKKAKKKYPYVRRDFTKCRGCGIRLQSTDPIQLGYVPPPNVKKSRKKKRICQRCYYLRFHNKEPPHLERNVHMKYETGLTAETVSEYLGEVLPSKSCVVLHMVDLSDMSPASFIPNLTKVAGTNPVLIVGTKLDLLPGDWRLPRLKLWLQKYAKKFCQLNQLPLTHVHVVSARSGQNVKVAMRDIDMFRKGRDLYVIGPVNCGKSSFINSALLHVGIGGVKYDKKYGLTTSNLPGTTLDAISMPLKAGGHLHDTPGFQVPNILPSLLAKERKMIISRKAIRAKIVFMREGKSILLGGCARLDYIRGPPLYFAIFTSSLLPHHLTSIEGADRMLASKLGTHLAPPMLLDDATMEKELQASEKYSKKLYKYLSSSPPPSQPQPTPEEEEEQEDVVELEEEEECELEDGATESGPSMAQLIAQMNQQRPYPLPEAFQEKRFELDYGGEDFDQAFADFVFPGVGWISATGKAEEPLVFRGQSFSEPYIREAVMPLEANRDKRKARGYTKHGKLSHYRYSPDESLSPSKE